MHIVNDLPTTLKTTDELALGRLNRAVHAFLGQHPGATHADVSAKFSLSDEDTGEELGRLRAYKMVTAKWDAAAEVWRHYQHGV